MNSSEKYQNGNSKQLLQSILDSDDLMQECTHIGQFIDNFSNNSRNKQQQPKVLLHPRKNFVSLNKQILVGSRRTFPRQQQLINKQRRNVNNSTSNKDDCKSHYNNQNSSECATYTINKTELNHSSARANFTGAPSAYRILNDHHLTEMIHREKRSHEFNHPIPSESINHVEVDITLQSTHLHPDKEPVDQQSHEQQNNMQYHKNKEIISPPVKQSQPAVTIIPRIIHVRELLQEIRRMAQCKGDDELSRLASGGELLTESVIKDSVRQNILSQGQPSSSFKKTTKKRIISVERKEKTASVENPQPAAAPQNQSDLSTFQLKNAKLQLSLANSKEEVKQLRFQYQSVIRQLCEKDSELTQMRHLHGDETKVLKQQNENLEKMIEKLKKELFDLQSVNEEQIKELKKSNGVIHTVREHFFTVVKNLSMEPRRNDEEPCLQTKSLSNQVTSTWTKTDSSEMLHRVIGLLDTVVHERRDVDVISRASAYPLNFPVDDHQAKITSDPFICSPSESLQQKHRSSPSYSEASWLSDDDLNTKSTEISMEPHSSLAQPTFSRGDSTCDMTPVNQIHSSQSFQSNYSINTVSTLKSVDDRDFTHGLAKLDAQIARLQKVLQCS